MSDDFTYFVVFEADNQLFKVLMTENQLFKTLIKLIISLKYHKICKIITHFCLCDEFWVD
jgi:hypothetical protein